MDKIQLSRSAGIIEAGLVRAVLYHCGYGATRDGDNLKVYSSRRSSSLYVNPKSIDDSSTEAGIKWVDTIYCDEGYQMDCLQPDGTVGVNKPWMEMCDMNQVFKLIVLKLDPSREFKSSPYIGRGFSARHYHKQFVAALDELLPSSELSKCLDWPEPPKDETTSCNTIATAV